MERMWTTSSFTNSTTKWLLIFLISADNIFLHYCIVVTDILELNSTQYVLLSRDEVSKTCNTKKMIFALNMIIFNVSSCNLDLQMRLQHLRGSWIMFFWILLISLLVDFSMIFLFIVRHLCSIKNILKGSYNILRTWTICWFI